MTLASWPEEAAYWTDDADGDPIIPIVRETDQVASAVTGMCLVNTNRPLAEHTHVCTRDAYRAHQQHRCHCGSEWPATTGATP